MAEIGDEPSAQAVPAPLTPFVPELALGWSLETAAPRSRRLTGTLVFADISGFTRLTEKLAAGGRFGAEEISEHLDHVLSALLESAYRLGGWLVKWGGDALLLMFEGEDHARRACAGAAEMRTTMARVGRLDTSVGRVRLRMSVGVHTGRFDVALLGAVHRELLITGTAATLTAVLEAAADAGEILLSPQTAARLPEPCRGAAKGPGILLARAPTSAVPERRNVPACDATHLLPELVVGHLLAGGGSGEHRPVAVGFLEFSGMARTARRAGRRAVFEALEHVVDATQLACQRYRVSFHETDISADGGKIMLVAGAPHGLDDPAEAMLCTLRDVIDNPPGNLRLRAGVTAGKVFTGCIGPSFRRSYSVKGDVVNLAARVMGKTPDGEVLAVPDVTDASRTTFALRPVPPFMVKGKTASVSASAVGPPVARARTLNDLPLAGRLAEVQQLAAALAHAKTGVGACVEIVGEAGTGKTRLLSEANDLAVGMTIVAAAGEPFRSGSPYAVVRNLLLDVTQLRGMPPELMLDAVQAWCQRCAPHARPWLPLLAPVLQIPMDTTPETADLAPEFRVERLRELILELFSAALPGPSLIVVDDVQFADPASVEILRHLIMHSAEQPWTLVLACRGAVDQDLTAAGAAPMVLHPLDDVAATELICADTADAPLSPHVTVALVELAAGNPLFLRQLARTSGSITSVADLPDSVETIVAAQIDRLRPAAREVLRACAVIGMSMDRQLLGVLLEDDRSSEETDQILEQLQEFLDVDGSQLRFRQAVTRETAYEGLPYRRRAALHGRLAALLDEAAGDRDAKAAVRSVHHFRAGDHVAAFRLSRLAADQAAAAHANVEAGRLYQQALESARHNSRVPARDRADVLESLGDAQVVLGEYQDGDRSYAAARRLLRDEPVGAARIEMKAARSASQRGDYQQTLQRLSRVQRLLSGVTELQARGVRVEARMRAAFTQFRQGRLAIARRSCRHVLEQASEQISPDVVADALGLLDVIEMSLGQHIDGHRSRQALELYDRLHGLVGQARMHNQLGYTAYLNGRWDDAVANYRAAQQLYHRLGDLPNAAVNDANVAEVLIDQGRLGDAEAAVQQALRIWRACGAENDVAFALALLGRTLARQAKYDDSRRLLEEARSRFSEQGALAEVVDVDAYLAECLMLSGRHGEALERADATLVAARRLAGDPAQGPLLYRVIGVCHDALDHPADADRAFAESLASARRRHADHELTFTIAAMSDRARRGGRQVDPELLREAIPMQRRLGVVIDLTGQDDPAPDVPAQSPAGDDLIMTGDPTSAGARS